MTIVTSVSCFEGYPYRAVDPELAAALSSIGLTVSRKACRTTGVLLRLECYLQLSRQSIRREDLDTERGAEQIGAFIAALYSPEFQDSSQPWALPLHFRQIYSRLVRKAKFPQFPCTFNQASWPPGFKEQVEQFRLDRADPELLEFWRGWSLTNLEGRRSRLRLWPVWETYGPQMTRELHRAAQDWFGGRRFQAIPCFNDFIDYLCAREPLLDSQNPVAVGEFFRDFFEHFCTTKHTAGIELETLTGHWMNFSALLQGHLLSHAWAEPIPTLPSPPRMAPQGSKTHLRRTSNGIEVRQALITPIPIQITDCEAKDLLFGSIRHEVDLLLRWARAEVAAARSRLETRRELCSKGLVNQVGRTGENTGLRARVSRDCPEHLAHAAATFEHFGFSYLDDQTPRTIFPLPLEQTTWELGLPTPELLLAHAAVLVATHPIITPSFLEHLVLFDKDEIQVGLVGTDAGWLLVGNKMRKPSAKGQQKVLLTSETLGVVRDVIELTRPLREYMKAKNDDRWRRLFLCIRSLGQRPNNWDAAHEASRGVNWLGEHIHDLTGLETGAALDLASRFSLKRLRSSAGVLVYIETGSVAAMAKALGHDTYRPKLLDHYLPGPIQEFFVERWVRLFQMGILCEALKESPYLHHIFDSMEELDTFLENHAFRAIPQHLRDPENTAEGEAPPDRRIVFGVNVQILSALRSLQYAVATATAAPCGRAVRWARISERLFDHLETQIDQPEFRAMAAEASRQASATKMESLIYG